MERRGRAFTTEHLQSTLSRVEILKETNEMALLVFLLLKTKLRVNELLGWFNLDPVARKKYLKTYHPEEDLLGGYESAPKLFTKTHQALLTQWQKKCRLWFPYQRATFEMLRRAPVKSVDENE